MIGAMPDEQRGDSRWTWVGLVGFFSFGVLGFTDPGWQVIWWLLAAASVVSFLATVVEWQ